MGNREKKTRIFCADFETTVYEGQTFTEVWASALVEIGSEEVTVLGSLPETFQYLKSLDSNLIVYYHNLKFDGHFWLDWISKQKKFEQALIYTYDKNGDPVTCEFKSPAKMDNNEYRYTISDRGQWYQIVIKINNHTIDIRDSMKLLPFSIKKIGKDFKTKHQKTSIEYEA